MKYICLILLVALSILCKYNCAAFQDQTANERHTRDSIPRPNGVSEHAILLNLGFEDLPVYAWVEFIGAYEYQNQNFSHIIGVRYVYTEGQPTDTMYYENLKLREKNAKFDFKNASISLFPGDATIQMASSSDTLYMFYVLENPEFKTNYKGVVYDRLPAIDKSPYEGFSVSSGDISINFKKIDANEYELTFLDGAPVTSVKYRLCKDCKSTLGVPSFFDMRDRRVYFLEKGCFLEPVE